MSDLLEAVSLHPDVADAARFVLQHGAADSVEALSEAVYQWYVNPTRPDDQAVDRASLRSASAITPATALRHAHAGSQRFEPGWTVDAHLGWGAISATSRAGISRVFRSGEYRRRASNGLPAVGESVLGEIAWSWVEESTGFWLTRRGVWEPTGATSLVRTYFNANPTQACTLITKLTTLLLRDGCSFMLKTPAARQHSGRADAVVLYLGDPDWRRLHMGITQATTDVITNDATPRFAARLAAGIAWSEGPLNGESFGKQRSDLIAAETHGRTFSSNADCTAHLAAAFQRAGLSLAEPHLHPSS